MKVASERVFQTHLVGLSEQALMQSMQVFSIQLVSLLQQLVQLGTEGAYASVECYAYMPV